MLPAQRRARVIEILRKERMASLKDLAAAIPISLSSLRRDVEYLDEAGFLERTHGGVLLKSNGLSQIEPDPDIASAIDCDAKSAIGRRAAQLIQPGQSVIFDSGSTTLAAAMAAAKRSIPFSVFTNDVRIANALLGNSAIQIEVSGGRIRPGSPTLLGSGAAKTFGRLKVDLALIGAHAIDGETFSDSSLELADLKADIIRSAKLVVLLVDSSKFGRRSLCAIGPVSDLDLIITDTRVDPAVAAHYRGLGIPIEQASAPG